MKKLKARVLSAAVVWALAGMLSASQAAQASVTVRGRVQFWRPDLNSYLPMKRVRVRIVLAEDVDWDTGDVETTCNDNGDYAIGKGNAWWSSGYKAYARVFAEVPDRLEIQDFYPQIDGYQAITGKVFAKDDKTRELNVFIGGPQNNVNYETGGIAALGATGDADATRGWRAFHMCDVGTDYRLRAEALGFGNFEEKEVVLPSSGAMSDVVNMAGDACTIPILDFILFPDKYFADPNNNNYGVRNSSHTLRHELSHALMYDNYTVPMASVPEKHSMDKQTEKKTFAFFEGWPEFFSEVSYRQAFAAPFIDLESLDSEWHKKVVSANGDGAYIEGENAAVLWDIYDPIGTEKCWQQNAESPGDETFRDGIENGMAKIRTLFVKYQPHSLTLDTDNFVSDYFSSAYGIHGSFVSAWLQEGYGQQHELKTILFNRGVKTNELLQRAPTAKIGAIDWQGFDLKIPITVTEDDAEDRPFVSVAVYAGETRIDSRVLSKSDWKGNTFQQTLPIKFALQKGASAPQFKVVVRDEMDTVVQKISATPPANAYINGVRIEVKDVYLGLGGQNVKNAGFEIIATNGKETRTLKHAGLSTSKNESLQAVEFNKELFTTLGPSAPIQLRVKWKFPFFIKGQTLMDEGDELLAVLDFSKGVPFDDSMMWDAGHNVKHPDGYTFYTGVQVNARLVPQTDQPTMIVPLIFTPQIPITFLPAPTAAKGAPEPSPDAPKKAPFTQKGAVSRANALMKRMARLQSEVAEINRELEYKMSAKGLAQRGEKSTKIPSAIELAQMNPPKAQALQSGDVSTLKSNPQLLSLKMPAFLEAASQGKELATKLTPEAIANLKELNERNALLTKRLASLQSEAAQVRAVLDKTPSSGRDKNERGGRRGRVSTQDGALNERQKAAFEKLDNIAEVANQLHPILSNQRLAITQGLTIGNKPIVVRPIDNGKVTEPIRIPTENREGRDAREDRKTRRDESKREDVAPRDDTTQPRVPIRRLPAVRVPTR